MAEKVNPGHPDKRKSISGLLAVLKNLPNGDCI